MVERRRYAEIRRLFGYGCQSSAARAARATELADATNIAINDGRAAFQTVHHIHLHVLPRRNGDKLSVAKGMLLRRDPDRDATAQILREALARIDASQSD